MNKNVLFVCCLAWMCCSSISAVGNAAGRNQTPADCVNPFIGTQGLGNTFPGATCPFGLVKLGPDCGDISSNMGYRHDGRVKGFSHLHVSGTGGGCKYGNILVSPFTGERPPADYGYMRDSEYAEPGFFSMSLGGGTVMAELTATPHTGIHRYTFTGKGKGGLLIDAGSILGADYGFGEAQILLGSEINIVSDREITGYNRVSGGWNTGKAFTVYFYACLNRPASSFGTWKDKNQSPKGRAEYDSGESVGAWLTFDKPSDKPVELRVGISFISTGKAKENCLREAMPVSFDEARANAKSSWNGMLERIKVTTGNKTELTKFYTAMYHTMLQPVDKTGENALWKSDAPYYDDFYCIWDTYRTSHPLLTLFAPERESAIVNSLIDIYKHEGYMPDGRSGDSNGRTQGGSNAEMVVADALLKNLPGINAGEAIEAMLKDAEVEPGGDGRMHGRGGLRDYNTLGYVSTDNERAGTRTVEYAANDWAIALCAKKYGRDDLYRKYSKRAGNWENLWKPVTFDGITGFIMPRKANGTWDEDFADPTWDYYCKTPPYKLGIEPYAEIGAKDRRPEKYTPVMAGSWCNFFYETNSWEYSFYVPHDVARLVEKCGGEEKFLQRLDDFFDKGHFNIDNEPGFLTPMLYNYVGKQYRTVERVRTLLDKYYTDKSDGLPGNDDSGAMSSWYVFHRMGFFPNAGQDVYLITAPSFPQVEIDMGNGRTLKVVAENLSDKNIYVKSVELNGKPWNKAWFRHSDIEHGAILTFHMDSKPVRWDTGSAPPSRSDGNGLYEALRMADPTIFCDTDGTYYLYGTGPDSDKGFGVYRSKDLKDWEGPVGALDGFVLTPETSWGTKGFWAPQVFRHDSKYYMVYTANEQLAVATADSPTGPFTQAEKKMMPATMKQIDPFVFFDNDGKAYLYHVRLTEGNRIYVAELNDDLMSVREETARECVHSENGWENTWNAEWPVAEGPTVIRQGGTYYLFYSANDFRNPDYAVGYATATSPLGPWTKQGVIISRNNMGMNGTGHGDLFKTADGGWNYVLHTHNNADEPSPRRTAIVELHEDNGKFAAEPATLRMLYKTSGNMQK